jgi:small multidrug resistance pump
VSKKRADCASDWAADEEAEEATPRFTPGFSLTLCYLLPMSYFYLAIAILAEVVATSMLKATDGFTKGLPSLVVVGGYALAFYMLSLTLRTMSVGVAYAIWAGTGVVLVSVAGVVIYKQTPDVWAGVGMTLIVAGVVIINLMSKSVMH